MKIKKNGNCMEINDVVINSPIPIGEGWEFRVVAYRDTEDVGVILFICVFFNTITKEVVICTSKGFGDFGEDVEFTEDNIIELDGGFLSGLIEVLQEVYNELYNKDGKKEGGNDGGEHHN